MAIRRLWADNALLYDARTFNMGTTQLNNFEFSRFYDGAETQNIDDTIETAAGMNEVPAFRGLAYIVLENLRISDFGNRVPNFQAEVVASLPRVISGDSPEGMAEGLDGVFILPIIWPELSAVFSRIRWIISRVLAKVMIYWER